jgi:hypothetical protein
LNDVALFVFLEGITATTGAKAKLLARENVRWEGEVLIFGLLDHPTAKLCYAWEIDGKVTAVLAEGPVESASDAVRAWIMTSR